MPASRSAAIVTSITRRIVDALHAADDFLGMDDLCLRLNAKPRNLRAALHWLQKCRAIDSIESGGRPYWFATPEADQRMRTIDEHKKEDEPRHVRKSRRATIRMRDTKVTK